MIKRISSITLKGIALAMAVAVVVSHTLGVLTSESTIAMLALGLAALALESLQKTDPASTKK
jgi:uncharacterized membrane protein